MSICCPIADPPIRLHSLSLPFLSVLETPSCNQATVAKPNFYPSPDTYITTNIPNVDDGFKHFDKSLDYELFEEGAVFSFVFADILSEFLFGGDDQLLQVAACGGVYVWREFIFFMRDSLILELLLMRRWAAFSLCLCSNS